MKENIYSNTLNFIGWLVVLVGIYISFLLSGFLENNVVFGVPVLDNYIYTKCDYEVAITGIISSFSVGLSCMAISKFIENKKSKE